MGRRKKNPHVEQQHVQASEVSRISSPSRLTNDEQAPARDFARFFQHGGDTKKRRTILRCGLSKYSRIFAWERKRWVSNGGLDYKSWKGAEMIGSLILWTTSVSCSTYSSARRPFNSLQKKKTQKTYV